ncbi:LCCL domain-containing protein [Pseudovirgaria hyperparasitica]|uniref:LCCL domain-containing protein n=1 Tax=Pseudovirgaria hyperparasitica TaxID=470096 RepID=A0A6A6W0R0_9PEZI|nr:LCCL domain-containing protein [Pseudovirgaria hyperparasitica]KAF2754661.1 LCCL domain-containing protein [Pseudovirgaria hyperparasitica]
MAHRLENTSNEPARPSEYRDDEASVSSDTITLDDSALIALSEASNDEYFRASQPRWKRYVPRISSSSRLSRYVKAVDKWIKGPQPPRRWHITPFFPAVQEFPIVLLERYCPKRKQKVAALILAYLAWFICFASILRKSAFSADVPGYGSPVNYGCEDRFWRDFNGCGLNGDLCRPFANRTIPFRCPANCKREIIANDHAVGDQEINYQSLVIGGADGDQSLDHARYRGDSFICGAGIHSGFIGDEKGGCGALRLTGEANHFPASKRKGISSVGFDSDFPLSFTFIDGSQAKCADLRWPLLGVSVIFTVIISLFTTSPAVFFWTMFTGMFFHTALVSDPPTQRDYHALISVTLERFLPAAFCAFVMYKYCAKRTLTGLTAQFEKTILWVGGCWVGSLNNYTFDKIPIQRLTPHDIKQQPGAIPALLIVIFSLLFIALGQAWALRVEGRLPRYLALYGTYVAGILIMVAIPSMNVRIHHYILGLLLIAGTSMQTRPSLLYQGILVGLFINGVARWGFASILETPFALRGDAKLGTLLPHILPPIIHANKGLSRHGVNPNITFEWKRPLPETPDRWEGVSVLVNDVERFRGYEDMGETSFTWEREADKLDLPTYFRFGYLRGSGVGDYSRAGVWGSDGGWTEMEAGPS